MDFDDDLGIIEGVEQSGARLSLARLKAAVDSMPDIKTLLRRAIDDLTN